KNKKKEDKKEERKKAIEEKAREKQEERRQKKKTKKEEAARPKGKYTKKKTFIDITKPPIEITSESQLDPKAILDLR
ncbi:hypothetical protein CHS0354_042677, partial [Potamilus streckersoni]